LLAELADHMVGTTRQPELVPQSDNVHRVPEHCLLPQDMDPFWYMRKKLEM
jgi:hypothetical protein